MSTLLLTAHLAAAAFMISHAALRLGRLGGLLDSPGGRKDHEGDIPLTGGIAIFVTILYGTWQIGIQPLTQTLLWVAAVPFLVGIIDDRVHLHAGLRLLIHYVCGILLATWGGIAIHNVGNLLTLGDIPLLLLTVPLTALSVAGLCNAYNMIDGIDGLSASLIAIPIATLGLFAVGVDHPQAPALLLMLAAILVFLCFNLGPDNAVLPKMFLGDAGSVTLGFLLTAVLVFFSQGPNALIKPVTALWLVTIPLMDMLATMLRRVRHGQNPMHADKSHLHHILMRMGLSRRQTLMFLLCYAIAAALLGRTFESTPESFSLLMYFVLFLCHCVFVMKAFKVSAYVRRQLGKTELSEQTFNEY